MLYLFKKRGDKHSAVNYRPVSLIAICCKLLEHIITSNIRNILAKIKYYMIANNGLRICETQLVISIQDLAKSLADGNQIDIL